MEIIVYAYHILMMVVLKSVNLAQINAGNVRHQIQTVLVVQLQIIDNYRRILAFVELE